MISQRCQGISKRESEISALFELCESASDYKALYWAFLPPEPKDKPIGKNGRLRCMGGIK
jgi:hypothetical protein